MGESQAAVKQWRTPVFVRTLRMRITSGLLLLTLTALTSLPAFADDTWNSIKGMAKQQAATKAETELGLPNPSPAGAKVYFIGIKDGDTVSSPVKVVFGLSGMGIAPAGTQFENSGHHHLLVDNPTADLTKPLPATDNIKHFGKGQTETSLDLKPGKHTLQLVLGDWKHQPHNPSVVSEKITITVK
jgi:hypothetical protein